ncbi:ABC transporter permease [Aneurinibacillus sp. REN35]|uniref:ABC transporter permease n=1 Tax=Aneurinibacillus sp. REN35 TaxID=3237286 RepID=UPI0035291687
MKDVWFRFYQNKLAFAGLLVFIGYLMLAVLGPYIAPYDPFKMQPNDMLQGPSTAHLFGTDQFGRDILSRVIYGSQISLKVGLISVSISLVIGVAMGVLAAYYGGWIDSVISRMTDVLFSFPDILLALALMAVLGPSLTNVMLAIGIVYIPIFARIARGSVLTIRDALYIDAARSIGVNSFTIMRRHVLPNVLAPIIVQATLSFAFAILTEAALSFLGLGVEPDTPSWGIMLNEGIDYMEMAWWIAVFPGLAITLAVLILNVLGDGLRDALDPSLREDAS